VSRIVATKSASATAAAQTARTRRSRSERSTLYETFGRVESIPDGNARLFMKKRLQPR
jgi:hypothetical protein